MPIKRVLVVGDGLSAACVAYFAHKAGAKVFHYTRSGEITGGMCEDVYDRDTGVYVSTCGPHIFHTDKEEIWKFVNKIATWVPYINSPMARYKNKYYNLPFNMNTFQQVFGTSTADAAREAIQADQVYCENPQNSEEMALSVAGKTIYEIFQKSYTEKQWKVSAKELPPSILSRVKLRFDYNNNYFNDLYQGLPLNGYTNFIRELFRLSEAENISTGNDESIEDLQEKYTCGIVYICCALDELSIDYENTYALHKAPKIPYLYTRFVRSEYSYSAAVVNHNDMSTPFTRTTNYALLWPRRRGKDFSVSELPLGPYNSSDKKSFENAVPCYPARDTEVYNLYKEMIMDKGWIPVGRLAENRYLDMSPAIENAFEVIKETVSNNITY